MTASCSTTTWPTAGWSAISPFRHFPETSFYQCIGVSKTGDPVAGGWYLYAVQADPANPSYLGKDPKFGLWRDAYYLSINLYASSATFDGVRVYGLDRNAMINGQPANAIGFTIAPAALGDQYGLLPATWGAGSAPPAGQPEWFMNINSSTTAGAVENQVFVRRFHVDFTTPANSTFGVGAGHTPDGIVTVNGFVDAFTSATPNLVPNGTTDATQWLDTLGDRLMYPLVYQNLGGTEIDICHPYDQQYRTDRDPVVPVQRDGKHDPGDAGAAGIVR